MWRYRIINPVPTSVCDALQIYNILSYKIFLLRFSSWTLDK
nr:MAG TPA: hypothetical protein [Caudoviricetes sp.]